MKGYSQSHQFIVLVTVLVATQQVTAIDTVPQLNISQYLGRWYQVYGNLVVNLFIGMNCKCSTADYGLLPNGSVYVLNACRLKTPNGELDTIEGYAYRPDESEPGKLKVVFSEAGSSGDYWVVQLGPPTFNGDYYQYSVVTDPYKLTLFVLARNVAEFKQNYDEEVLTKLKEQGFTRFYNRPKKVYQGPDCDYVHLDTPKILQDENTRDKLNLYV